MILVTGATGFVGREVVAALTAGGASVRALVHDEGHTSALEGFDVEIVRGDVLDVESLRRACEGVDAVIHLAAIIRERGAMTFRRLNYDGTKNLLEAAAPAGVRRIVLASTIGASSDPGAAYLNSRWMAEQEVVRSPIPHTIVRFSVGFGDGDEFFNVLAALVKLSPVVPIAGDGKARFQPIAVQDIARCLVVAYGSDDTVGKTIEAGGPEVFTYEELVDLVADILGVRIAKVHVPMALVRPAAAVAEALSPRPPVTREQLKMLSLDNSAGIGTVESVFGFAPMSPKDNMGYITRIGLRDAIKINLGMMPAHVRDH